MIARFFLLAFLFVLSFLLTVLLVFSCYKEQIEKIDWTKRRVTRINMSQIEKAVIGFRAIYRRLPENMDELLNPPPIAGGVAPGGFLSEVPKDGWGNEIIYQLDNTKRKGYVLISYGADGKPGGEGNNEDITNE